MLVELKSGELIHAEGFGLQNAMSAIEIMDPRMDAGIASLTSGSPLVTLQEVVQRIEYSEDEITHLLSHTTRALTAFLRGDVSFPHSLLTILYTHAPSSIQHGFLGAYFEMLVGLIKSVEQTGTLGGIVFEEDSGTAVQLCGLSNVYPVGNSISELMNEMEEAIRVHGQSETVGQYARLLMSFAWIVDNVTDPTVSYDQLKHHFDALKSSISYLKQHVINEQQNQDSISESLPFGCDPRVIRKLSTYMPPPSTSLRFPSIVESMAFFQDASRDFEHIFALSNTDFGIAASEEDEGVLMYRLFKFNVWKVETAPSALTRSILQLCMNKGAADGSGHSRHFPMIRNAYTRFTYPYCLTNSLSSETGSEISGLVSGILSQTCRIWEDLIRILSYNSGRARRVLHKLISSLDHLQSEAEGVDMAIHQLRFPDQAEDQTKVQFDLALWVYTFKLRMMRELILLGFDLGLYSCSASSQLGRSVGEMGVMYWYVYYLTGLESQNVQRAAVMKQSNIQMENRQRQTQQQPTGKKKNKTKNQQSQQRAGLNDEEMRLAVEYHQQTLHVLAIESELYKANSHLFTLLTRLSGLQKPEDRDVVEQTLVQMMHYRFGKFEHLSSPPAVNVEHFDQSLGHLNNVQLLEQASQSFKQAKHMIASLNQAISSLKKADKNVGWLERYGWTDGEVSMVLRYVVMQSLACTQLVDKVNATATVSFTIRNGPWQGRRFPVVSVK